MTFVVDVVLKGRERELAALLILLRLIRFAAEGIYFLLSHDPNVECAYSCSRCWRVQ